MAYSYYLNYEKVAIEIIEQQIELMTDDNVIYDETYDFDLIKEESFFNNLNNQIKEYYDKHGYDRAANVFTAACGSSVIY